MLRLYFGTTQIDLTGSGLGAQLVTQLRVGSTQTFSFRRSR